MLRYTRQLFTNQLKRAFLDEHDPLEVVAAPELELEASDHQADLIGGR